MSYDLEIYSHLAVTRELMIAVLRRNGWLIESGSGTSMPLTRERPSGPEQLGELDGPLEVEGDDLPDAVAPSVLSARWLIQLHVGNTQSAVSASERLARALADEVQGVVFDPQRDAVKWPRSGRRRPDLGKSGETRIAVVELNWCFARRLDDGDAREVLGVLKRRLPEALPRRFGVYEPLQGRLDRDGDDGFASFWLGEQTLFWKATSPCFGGSATLWRNNRPRRDDPQLPWIDRIGLSFDARALMANDAWSDAVADVLVALADRLHPFYAAASMDLNVGCSRNNSLWYDGEVEQYPTIGRFWLGLPPFATWLTWFGPTYSRCVAPALARPLADDVSVAHRRSGALLRVGATPRGAPLLRSQYPQLPQELIRTGGIHSYESMATTIPDLVAT